MEGQGRQAGVSSVWCCLQVRLICEYCDRGSLREALDLGAFKLPDGSVNYPAVLDTAIEIATAVAHLHHRNVLHSDLKVGWLYWLPQQRTPALGLLAVVDGM